MKIKNLNHYIINNSDEIILNALNKSEDKEIIEYVINLTSDLLNGVFLSEEYKNNALNNLKNYSDDEIGQISTYVTLIPYVQSALKQDSNWAEKATSFLEMFISFIIGMSDKEEFLINLYEMRNILNLSDKFYNGLVIFFRGNHEYIKDNILKKLQ